MSRKHTLASLRPHTTFHEPNTHKWQPGDIVIHDADAKRPDMLMVVVGCSRAGVYRTRYLFPSEQPKNWRKKVWRNTAEPLHDPRRFGITLRGNPEAPLTLATIRESTFSKTMTQGVHRSSAVGADNTDGGKNALRSDNHVPPR